MHVYRIAQVVCSTSKSQDGVSQICGRGRRENFFLKKVAKLYFTFQLNSLICSIYSVKTFSDPYIIWWTPPHSLQCVEINFMRTFLRKSTSKVWSHPICKLLNILNLLYTGISIQYQPKLQKCDKYTNFCCSILCASKCPSNIYFNTLCPPPKKKPTGEYL